MLAADWVGVLENGFGGGDMGARLPGVPGEGRWDEKGGGGIKLLEGLGVVAAAACDEKGGMETGAVDGAGAMGAAPNVE